MASMEVSSADKDSRSKNRPCYWGGQISDSDATYHRKHYGGKRGGIFRLSLMRSETNHVMMCALFALFLSCYKVLYRLIDGDMSIN